MYKSQVCAVHHHAHRPAYMQIKRATATLANQAALCDLDTCCAALLTLEVRPEFRVYCVVHGVALSTLVICAVA